MTNEDVTPITPESSPMNPHFSPRATAMHSVVCHAERSPPLGGRSRSISQGNTLIPAADLSWRLSALKDASLRFTSLSMTCWGLRVVRDAGETAYPAASAESACCGTPWERPNL